jgi:hypothetical protein
LWKNGVSLYTTGAENFERFRSKHPTLKTGKASLNFKLTDEIPDWDVRDLLPQALG